MADLEAIAAVLGQPGGLEAIEPSLRDPKLESIIKDSFGYLKCNDAVAGDLVRNVTKSLDSNSACREGVSREARTEIKRLLDENALVSVLKVHAELARGGLPVAQWARPACVTVPPRLRAVERLADPSPEALWRYVATNTPCVIANAFDAMDAFRTFRDDAHLSKTCGGRDVLVRTSCHPDAAGRHVFIEGGASMRPFKLYLDALAESRAKDETPRQYTGKIELDTYRLRRPTGSSSRRRRDRDADRPSTNRGDAAATTWTVRGRDADRPSTNRGDTATTTRMVRGDGVGRRYLPEMADEIKRGATDPKRKYGALFGDVTKEGPVMYFGGGRNTTKTHFDPYDNLMLVFDGSKRLRLWPPSDCAHLYCRGADIPWRRVAATPRLRRG